MKDRRKCSCENLLGLLYDRSVVLKSELQASCSGARSRGGRGSQGLLVQQHVTVVLPQPLSLLQRGAGCAGGRRRGAASGPPEARGETAGLLVFSGL